MSVIQASTLSQVRSLAADWNEKHPSHRIDVQAVRSKSGLCKGKIFFALTADGNGNQAIKIRLLSPLERILRIICRIFARCDLYRDIKIEQNSLQLIWNEIERETKFNSPMAPHPLPLAPSLALPPPSLEVRQPPPIVRDVPPPSLGGSSASMPPKSTVTVSTTATMPKHILSSRYRRKEEGAATTIPDYPEIVDEMVARLSLETERPSFTTRLTVGFKSSSLKIGEGENAGMISLEALMPQEMIRQLGMDIVVVGDRSGSMQGSGITALKTACHTLRESLRPEDRLGIMLYDNLVDAQYPMEYVIPAKKTAFDSAVSRIVSRGSTEMLPAIKAALAVMLRVNQANALKNFSRPALIILMTDGENGSSISELLVSNLKSEAHAKGLNTENLYVVAIGMGDQHKSQDLQLITRIFPGKYMATDFSGLAVTFVEACQQVKINVFIPNKVQIKTSENVQIKEIFHPSPLVEKLSEREWLVPLLPMRNGASRMIPFLFAGEGQIVVSGTGLDLSNRPVTYQSVEVLKPTPREDDLPNLYESYIHYRRILNRIEQESNVEINIKSIQEAVLQLGAVSFPLLPPLISLLDKLQTRTEDFNLSATLQQMRQAPCDMEDYSKVTRTIQVICCKMERMGAFYVGGNAEASRYLQANYDYFARTSTTSNLLQTVKPITRTIHKVTQLPLEVAALIHSYLKTFTLRPSTLGNELLALTHWDFSTFTTKHDLFKVEERGELLSDNEDSAFKDRKFSSFADLLEELS